MINLFDSLAKIFDKVKVGDPLNPNTQMGSLIYERHLKDVLNYIEIGKKEGARLVTGGVRLEDEEHKNGFYLKPTILLMLQ